MAVLLIQTKKLTILQKLFYTDVYSPNPVDECQNKILANLPTLNDYQQEILDSVISYDELSTAVSKSSNNKSGIDGLPSEFYETSWTLIGKDFHEVFFVFHRT